MTTHATPAPDRTDASATATAAPEPAGGKVIPHLRNGVGGVIAFAGLAIALLSLFVPWLSGAGRSITGIGITEVLDLRAMLPLNFLGLIVLSFLASVMLFARLGIFAIMNAITATAVLAAHLTFVWVLMNSTGASDPLLSGLPAGVSVTYGPFLAALGFVMVIVGSVLASRAAEYLLPDRPEGRRLLDS